MDYLSTSKGPDERCLCDGGIDKRSVHDVVHVRAFARISIVLEMIQEFLNGKEPNRPHQAVFWSSRAGCHFHRKGLFSSEGFG